MRFCFVLRKQVLSSICDRKASADPVTLTEMRGYIYRCASIICNLHVLFDICVLENDMWLSVKHMIV